MSERDRRRRRALAAARAEDSERVASIVSFGYPAREVDPARRTAEQWVAAADRKPFDEIVTYA
jgi:hypothetical protein